MLTLRELKKLVGEPGQGEKIPTVKCLKASGMPVIGKEFGGDAGIAIYPKGYALYQAGGHSTVFPVHVCGDYLYMSGNHSVRIAEDFFNNEPWYVRLILEGEDRLSRNQDEKEQGRTVSYSIISDEWNIMADLKEPALELLIRQETIKEMMKLLTRKQCKVLQMFFIQGKTQKQISEELHISKSSVYAIISQAFRRIREKYPSDIQLSGTKKNFRSEIDGAVTFGCHDKLSRQKYANTIRRE